MDKLKKTIEHLFYVFVFLLPWQTRWIFEAADINNGFWEYGSKSLYGTEILLWIILFFFFFYLIKIRKQNNYLVEFKSFKFKILACIYALLLITGLSAFWSRSSGLGLFFFFRMVEGVSLFLFIVNFKFSKIKFWWAIVLSAVLQGLMAIQQFFMQAVFANKWLGLAAHRPEILGNSVIENSAGRWLRAYGSLPHPNILAGFLIFGIIGVYYLWNKKTDKKLLLFFSVFIIAGLVFSFSRSGWLAVLALMVVWWLSSLNKRERRNSMLKFGAYYLIIGLVFVLIVGQPFVTRLKGGERLEIKSVQQRLDQFDQAKELISENRFWGVGAGNYTLAVYQDINWKLAAWDYQPVHNMFLLIWAELGLFGFIIFSLLYLLILIYNLRKKNYFGLSILVALLAISMFDHYLWTLYFGIILFWLGLGMSLKKAPGA